MRPVAAGQYIASPSNPIDCYAPAAPQALIARDVRYALKKRVPSRLWQLFYKEIEEYQRLLRSMRASM